MARTLNVAPFKVFLRKVEGQVLRTTRRYVEARTKRVMTDILALNQTFWPTFVDKVIDVSQAPNLNEFTPVWKPINPNSDYGRHKAKIGRGFYYNTGRLQASLKQARIGLLGKPVIEFQKLPAKVAAGESYRFSINPMPRLSGLRGSALLQAINGSTEQRAIKLSNFKGARNRDIFEPYVKWWMKYVITPRVMRSLK
jgi:hypothetical protein